jgi:hypothetical protein
VIEDLVELLDRRWAFLDAQRGLHFVAQAFAFFAGLGRDPRTSAILEELRDDERASLKRASDAEVNSRLALLDIVDRLDRLRPSIFPTIAAPDDFDMTAGGLRRRLNPDLLTYPAGKVAGFGAATA